MATFTWKIVKLSVIENVAEQKDVVSHAVFVINIVKDDGTELLESVNCPFRYVEGEHFTPYESLTQNDIINWLGNRKNLIENDILQRINKTAPTPTDKPLPWVTQ
jgi:ethanolamine utilization cobalamin adenosyltransferase